MNLEKQKKFLINVAYFAVLLLGAYVLLKYGLPMLTPFVIAFVIASVLRKPIRFLTRNLRLPWKLSALVTILLFYATVGSLVALLGIKLFSTGAALVRAMPVIYEEYAKPVFLIIMNNTEDLLLRTDASIVAGLDGLGSQILQYIGQLVSGASVFAVSFASGVASGLPGLFIQLVLMIISTFFIAMDYDRLTGFCLQQLGEKGKYIFLEIKTYVIGTLFVCIRSYLLIMSITFVELSIGLSIIGVKYAILVAFCIAIFDVLPVLGTGGIMLPWAALAAISGNLPMGLELLVIYLVITVIRNIIEPKIVGSQLGLHPVVTLSSMFVGAQFFGVIGLFGFPIVLSLLRHLNDHGVIKIFK